MSNAALLNRIANLPEVLEGVAPGYSWVDLSAFFNNPHNVMLGDERGLAIFAERPGERGVFEGHYLFPTAGREWRHGQVLELCRSWLRAMFTEHAAQAIWGYVSTENAASRALSRALGFAPRGHSLLPSGRPCVVYVLERATWAKSSGES